MAQKPPQERPMSILGWEIATTLPIWTGATIAGLAADCVYNPWFAPAQPLLPLAEAQKLIRRALLHKVGPFLRAARGDGSLCREKAKGKGGALAYSLRPKAAKFVSDEFHRREPELRACMRAVRGATAACGGKRFSTKSP